MTNKEKLLKAENLMSDVAERLTDVILGKDVDIIKLRDNAEKACEELATLKIKGEK